MKIFALLVGINEYASKPLRGCINDIIAVEKFLKSNYQSDDLNIKTLTNSQATKQGIIDGFKWFESARDGDTCLFYYSGHGSYMPAAKEFWTETDGQLETLVCYDSRVGNGRDLANKELAFLIWQYSQNKNINFVLITDSCHSGSITRDLLDENNWRTDRTTPTRNDIMPVEEFYGFNMTINGKRGFNDRVENGVRKVDTHIGNHIHIAASRDNQTAKEDQIGGEHHGIFTYALLQTLYQNNAKINYKNLIDSASSRVKKWALDQDPSLNIIGGDELISQKIFLNEEILKQGQQIYKAYFDAEKGWSINGGGVNGFLQGDLIRIKNHTDFKISTLGQDASIFIGDNTLDEKEVYDCKIIKNKKIPVSFGWGDESKWGWESDKKAIREKAQGALDFYIVDDDSGDFFIQERFEKGVAKVFLTHKNSHHALFEKIERDSDRAFEKLVENIDTVCRWTLLKDLSNPNSAINAHDFDIKIDEVGVGEATTADGGYSFYYKLDAASQKWKAPKLKIKLQNKVTGKALIAQPIYLGFDYSVDTSSFNKLSIKDQAQYVNLTTNGKTEEVLNFALDKKYLDLGYNQITEYLKVFVSTKELNLSSNAQAGIKLEKADDTSRDLKDLVEKSLTTDPDDDEQVDDWQAFTIKLTVTKTVEEPLGAEETKVFKSGLAFKKASGFSGKIGFSTSAELKQRATRGVDATNDLHQLNETKGNDIFEPAELVANHGQGQSLNIIEIFDAVNPSAVNYTSPLEITPQKEMAVDESIVPFGYDPETQSYYPIGISNAEGKIIINELPAETPSDAAITQRSLLGSIKIYFYKVVGQRIGIKYDYPQLAIATVDTDYKLTYETDSAQVKAAVAKANKILVFIHGIIGDTEGMAKVVRKAKAKSGKVLADEYDLTLTFDYENLGTKIQDTAADFKKRLTEAGLGEGHQKEVVIIAHSMGGLVSRYFIEKLGGDKQVSHLIMLGTPNGGSEWADVRDLAELLLTKAVNGASFLKPWLIPLSFVGKIFGGVQITLKQMNDTSDFMAELNDQTKPATKYSIIAGNTQLIGDFENKQACFLKKVILRLKEKPVYAGLDLLVFKEANDIAVKVKNISNIKGQNPVVIEVASDHISYFGEPAAYSELGNLL